MPTNTQHITPAELKDMLPQKPELTKRTLT